MEYTKRRRYTVNTEADELKDIYPHDLCMYDFPPTGEISFLEFQQLGHDRLKLLQHIETNGLRTELKTLDERKSNLSTALTKDGLKYFAHLLFGKGCKSSTELDLQARRKDHISHFIMRLSYCQDPDRQTWFINHEVDLFKLRFSSLDKDGTEKLLTMHNMCCNQITHEKKEEIREELRLSVSKAVNVDMTEFYTVPFQRVTDLVKSRRVYVSQGLAYVPQADLVSFFASHFRKMLIDGMEYAKHYLMNISDDERLMSFLKSLPGSFSGMTRVVWTSVATPIEKLDELSRTSYPLCMRSLHEALKTNHHLKNSGRLQYGLFIKGIGVTLEDALHFWKTEFSKGKDPEKVDKEYTYGIRYLYGKEGKQLSYTPLGCPKIINSAVGPGEYHGCPYRHMDQDSLKQKLVSYGLSITNITEIIDLAKDGYYHVACAKYFETLHNRLPEKPILHPNGYFVESRAILAKDTESESDQKPSQNGKINEKGSGTPSRRVDRFSGTPSRNFESSMGTPSRNINRINGTPSRNVRTPSRITDNNATPTRKLVSSMTPERVVRNIPKRIETDLTVNEIAELIDDDF